MRLAVCRCLRGSDRSSANGGEIGFPIADEFLHVLDRVLGLVFELPGPLGKQLPRFLSGLGCVQQCDASADQGADGEDGEAASRG
jgi:hypothetical protein